MNIHEYQARQLFREYGIPVSKGEVIFRPDHAPAAFERVANPHAMVKVQVLVGGRGKAGGIQKVHNKDQARHWASAFLGKNFSTQQSGGRPSLVKAVFLAEHTEIQREYYLGVTMDRSRRLPVLLFSAMGGVDIEEVARQNPEAIEKFHFSPDRPPDLAAWSGCSAKVVSSKSLVNALADIAARLARLFVEKDASLCEINPLCLTAQNQLLAIDAKIVFDDNALFRHEDIQELKDPEEEDPRERKAKAFGLSYVSMEGNVGCLVNGAGLAMATLDMIQLAGGRPANFLDVGGGATVEGVREGFKIILQDPRVEAILVNIFGGIMKCDVIAQGVIQASREMRLEVPLVVRLEGTRVEEGRALLKESGLSIFTAVTIPEAAQQAVRKAQEVHQSRVYSRG